MFTGTREGYQVIAEASTQTLVNNQDQQDKLCISGYKANFIRQWCFYISTVLLAGIPLLLLHWYKQLIVVKYVKTSLKDADFILVKDSYDIYSVHSVHTVILSPSSSVTFRKSISTVLNVSHVTRFFIHNDIKYIWCDISNQFSQLRGWDNGVKYVKELLEDSMGYTKEEQEMLLELYGKNEIDVRVKSYWWLLTKEVLHPFYLFQLFSVILWSFDDYLYYAVCVIFFTVVSMCLSLYNTKHQTESLRDLVNRSAVNSVTVVRRNGCVEEISSQDLVPGDVIEIPSHGCVMACDAVLLHGNCIVNESTLTGESAPVTKTPPPCINDTFDSVIFKRHTLFCGTEIMQTRYYGDDRVKAVVVNTGFSTAKGELVRSILHPKPIGFKFYEDSLKFVCGLFVLATLGMSYLLYIYIKRGVDAETIILDCLDLITIVVPPALPAAMTTGIMYSQARLLKKGIFCISPPRINVCGKLKLLCFDKTGTLTEEGLDLWGVIPSVSSMFIEVIEDPSTMDPEDPLTVAMATCHSLTLIEGKLSGDPLDVSMFSALDWDLEEPGNDTNRYDLLCPTIVKPKPRKNPPKPSLTFPEASKDLILTNKDEWRSMPNVSNEEGHQESQALRWESAACLTSEQESKPEGDTAVIPTENDDEFALPYEIGIVREFPFTSATQCASVITRCLGECHMNLYCKGAPEKIQDLCVAETIPKNFSSELQLYTSSGFRVLGIAYKAFDQKFTWRKSQRAKREEIEYGLTFLGLLIMQNTLKEMTTPIMRELRAANLRCVMITGDNLLTALSVSRECLMVLPNDSIVQIIVLPPDETRAIPMLSFQPIGPCDRYAELYGPYDFSCSDYSKSSTSTLEIDASDCHYVLDGKTWALLRTYYSELIPRIIVRGTIFARMLPEQKTQLIEAFQDLDYVVGMCGDGANDCGAMKAAHIGVSLSEAESSVAAPFTSKIPDISCVMSLIKEGRCALVTSFVIFKYMAMYSLIQFISVLILYQKGIALGNMEFLYVDLVITTTLAVVIGRTGPAKSLAKTRPIACLVAPANVLPLFLQILFTFLIQFSSAYYLYLQNWFVPVNPTTEEVTTCWENTVVYCVSSFQYLTLALIYSKGKPHRQPFYVDRWFMVTLVILSAFTALLCVYPVSPIAEFFELVPVNEDSYQQSMFRLQLLVFPLLNLLISFVIEASITNKKWFKKLMSRKKTTPKNKYKRILLEPILQSYLTQNTNC